MTGVITVCAATSTYELFFYSRGHLNGTGYPDNNNFTNSRLVSHCLSLQNFTILSLKTKMQYFAELSQEQLEDILRDVGTDEQSLKRDVNYLITWLEQTPYLPSVKGKFLLSSREG